ncbi:hypothetical protein [Weissella confusa]
MAFKKEKKSELVQRVEELTEKAAAYNNRTVELENKIEATKKALEVETNAEKYLELKKDLEDDQVRLSFVNNEETDATISLGELNKLKVELRKEAFSKLQPKRRELNALLAEAQTAVEELIIEARKVGNDYSNKLFSLSQELNEANGEHYIYYDRIDTTDYTLTTLNNFLKPYKK